MKVGRASWFARCLSLTLTLGLTIVPVLLAADAQPVVGNWEGTLEPGAQPKKRILVHITADQDGSLHGTIDYPNENSSGIAITAITYKELSLHFESSQIQSFYDGLMNKEGSEFRGTWKQGGAGLTLVLTRIP
jgi:hypothetical protein